MTDVNKKIPHEPVEGLSFQCPRCRSPLDRDQEKNTYTCSNPGCTTRYPVHNGVPLLINEERSLFAIDDFLMEKDTFFPGSRTQKARVSGLLKRCLPRISVNIAAKENYPAFASHVLERSLEPRILVVGSGELGLGLKTIHEHPSLTFIETDVSLGSRVSVVCDAHDLPFPDGSFQGVIIQAVLEHVVDPERCVEEVHRVLAPGGVVYAETAFMQQVHGGRYDYMRFSPLGHRLLFKGFDELASGMACGPGTAMAWSYKYFMMSFAKGRKSRALLSGFSQVTGFWLKYFDYLFKQRRPALDAASGVFFMGTKREEPHTARELVETFQGAT